MVSRQKGFSLVELLVVIAIVGVLLSMILPAVQRVREAANRLRCQNNMRQIGIGIHGYHDAYAVFPPAVINPGYLAYKDWLFPLRSFYEGKEYFCYNHTGFTLLLAHIEQEALYKQYDFQNYPASNVSCFPTGFPDVDPTHGPYPTKWPKELDLANYPNGVQGSPNEQVISARVPTYECPSDKEPTIDSFQGGPVGNPAYAYYTHYNARRSNYRFASHTSEDAFVYDYPDSTGGDGIPDPKGAFGVNGGARLVSITDGTSNTIAIGESKQLGATGTVPSFGHIGAYWGAGCRASVIGYVFDATYTINYDWGTNGLGVSPPDPRVGLQRLNGFGSYHQGGASFVFCDGSARFLKNSTSYPLLSAMITINGGEPLPQDP